MKPKLYLFLAIAAALAAAFAFPLTVFADGIIIPDPPICDPGPCPPIPLPMEQLVVRYHHVTVTIVDQVAVTHVDQVFYNPNDWQIEGTYIFPIPVDAAVSGFTLWVDGQPVEGQVLSADEARQTYEQIVSSMRDPALLEYAGRGALQARVFPIAPQAERRIELEYSQALAAENGLVRYVYPLSTEKFSARPLESVTISVDVQSNVPIRAVYSPSHDIGVSRESDAHVTAGYEANHVLPESDFSLYYSLGKTEAFHVLSYRDATDPTDPDGFFLVLLAPRVQAAEAIIPKDVILVLDRSGSMDGEKFTQAQEALRYVLQHLNPDDRFNIITFSTGIEMYAEGLRPASEANEALPWVNSLWAEGSTDINRALLEAAAIANPERATYVIFLTDGLPTQGETDSAAILKNLAANAPENLRLFVFGVGYDVDTYLLDSLAQEHHGASSYVLPGEPLDEIVSGFYARVSTPVLTNLALDFEGISAYDLYPNPLPDLFAGSQIIAVGRYRQGGSTDVTLTGEFNGEIRTFSYPGQFLAQQSAFSDQMSAIPRLWATRKVGHLLNQIRLYGPDQETIDQIVRLSIRYGIVTPYTSYLVTEDVDDALSSSGQDRIAQEQYEAQVNMPTAAPSGAGAVGKAADQGALAGAEHIAPLVDTVAEVVKIVGARTFVLSDGVWMDTTFDPDTMQTIKVGFLSEDYFALSAASPDIAAAFALGQRVIVLWEHQAYEVVAEGEPTGPIALPTSQPPDATPTPEPPVGPDLDPTLAPTPDDGGDANSIQPAAPCGAGLLALLPLAGAVIFRKRCS